MADRGYDLCETEDGTFFWWKRCEMDGCPNNICERLSPIYCYPHSQIGRMLLDILEKAKQQKNPAGAG